jgi:hypothetical protein
MPVSKTVFVITGALICASAVLPATAQGRPSSTDTRGLEKVRWYKAPLQIQILNGPRATEFGGGSTGSGAYSLQPAGPVSNIPGGGALPPAGLQSNIVGGAPVVAAPAMVQSPASLPQAQFRSNVPVRQISQGPNLPSGASTNLMGKLFKPQQPPGYTAQALPRHHLLSQPTGRGAVHLPNPSNPNVQPISNVRNIATAPAESGPVTQTVKRYADYPTAAGVSAGASRVSTSVSGKIKRGSLLTDR